MKDKKRSYSIGLFLEALPDPIPGQVRIRRALKSLLRTYGLTCRLFVSEATLEADQLLTEVDFAKRPWSRREAKERKSSYKHGL